MEVYIRKKRFILAPLVCNMRWKAFFPFKSSRQWMFRQRNADRDAFRIGRWTVEPSLNRIVCGSDARTVDRKAMEVLEALIEAPGRILSVEALLDAVWSDRVVEPGTVHQRIAALRRAFDDDAREPQYIETIPRRGYRLLVEPESAGPFQPFLSNVSTARKTLLIAAGLFGIGIVLYGSVVLLERQEPEMRWMLDYQPPSKIFKAVVLPFQDASPGGDLDWLALGIAQGIRNQLGHLPQYEIAPAVNSDREVIKSLNPDLVVDGIVQADSNGVQILLEATDGSGSRLWSKTVTAPYESLIDLQDQIAAQLARFTDASIVDADWGPRDPRAYRYFLEWIHAEEASNAEDTIDWMNSILRIDSSWGRGWEALGLARLSLGVQLRDKAMLDRARETLTGVEEKSGDRIEDLYCQGVVAWHLDGDLDRAERLIRDHVFATRGFPIQYARFMRDAGLAREAERVIAKHNEIWNLWVQSYLDLAFTRTRLNDVAGVAEALEGYKRVVPGGSEPFLETWIHARRGDLNGLLDVAERIEAEQGSPDLSAASRATLRRVRSQIEVEIGILSGDIQRAVAAVDQRVQWDPSPVNGINYLRLGMEDAARTSLLREPEVWEHATWPWVAMWIPTELWEHPLVRSYRERLGYSDRWRQELCRRAAEFPPESGIGCNVSGLGAADGFEEA